MLTLTTDWDDCRTLWLQTLERSSTRTSREYQRINCAFFADQPGLQPWEVTPTHADHWVADLARRLAPASVNKAVSAMASFYRFANHYHCDGQVLWSLPNPFAAQHLRARVQRYARARYPSVDQVRALLEQMDTSSPLGLRDRALFGGLFTTTRRINEWLPLRWVDITGNAFVVRVKGGRTLRQTAPDGLLAEVVAWLQCAGHYPPAPTEYIFTALGVWDRPLNPGYVNARLRHYGRLAGVPARLCHAHGLRHAGARWRYQQGATPYQLQQTLAHRNIATTEIYIRDVLSEPEDPQAPAVDAFLASLRSAPAVSPLTAARIPSSRGYSTFAPTSHSEAITP